MIAVSWMAQSMNREQRIQQIQPQCAAYLTRDARLNERRVGAGGSLDDENREPHERQAKRLVLERSTGPEAAGRSTAHPESCRERHSERPCDERDERVAKRMQRDRREKAHQATTSSQNLAKPADVISADPRRQP